jgi:hypothetical protein
MVSVRRLVRWLPALYTLMLVALFLIAVGPRSRHTEVAIEPPGMVRPKLTAQDAKNALVEMFKEFAARGPSRCREVWGSPEPDRQLAAVPIRSNSDGTTQIGIFTVRLGEQNYFFWGGPNLYEGSFRWEQTGWWASDYRVTAHGCLIGRVCRKGAMPRPNPGES